MRGKHRNRFVGAMLVALVLILSACASGDDAVDTTTTVAVVDDGGTTTTTESPDTTPTEPGTTIEIASFAFGESEILGEIYAQALEANGYPVNHQVQVGPREVLKPALESGEVHFVPEYLGSGLEAGFGVEPSADAVATRDLLIAAYQPAGVAVLDLAPGEDKNTFVVTKALADELGLSKVSDLSKVEDFVLGGPPECPERPRCQLGLEGVYGLNISEFKALDAGGPLTVAALNGVDIILTTFSREDPTIFLKNNCDGTFTDVTQTANTAIGPGTGATLFDYDNDGLLDLYVINFVDTLVFIRDNNGDVIGFDHVCYPNQFYRNMGNFEFKDLTDDYQIREWLCPRRSCFAFGGQKVGCVHR